jgi:hypothetical protein
MGHSADTVPRNLFRLLSYFKGLTRKDTKVHEGKSRFARRLSPHESFGFIIYNRKFYFLFGT